LSSTVVSCGWFRRDKHKDISLMYESNFEQVLC
jgi:hypothetical protein